MEVRLEQFGQRFHRRGLGQARHAFDQHMPVAEQRDQQAPGQRVLADDAGIERCREAGKHLAGRRLRELGPGIRILQHAMRPLHG
ncbi:MAG TPA: hypothetical protein VIS77_02360 [Burkholderiales bacterium]